MKELTTSNNNRDFIIKIGQNAKENWKLIDEAEEDNLWFHLENEPSGHVIIKEITENKKADNKKNDFFGYPKELIILGSTYCKSQSKYKNKNAWIIYSTISNIKKGKEEGSVFVKKSKRIFI